MAERDHNTGRPSIVAGLFYDQASADAAIQQLSAAGFASAGVGATPGGVVEALVGMGIPEADARQFEQGFDEGGILLTVEAGERSRLALEILSESGGDIRPTYEEFGPPAEMTMDTRVDGGSRSLETTDRRRALEPGYEGPERRLASRRR